MSNILSAFLLLFLLGAAFSPDLSYSLENPKKNWYDYTDSEKEQLRTRWTEVEIDLVAVALKNGEALPGFVNRVPLSEQDNKLLKECGVTSLNDCIKNYDLRGIYLENEDLSNLNLNIVNLQGARLRGTNLSNAKLLGAKLNNTDLSDSFLNGSSLIGAEFIDVNLKNAVLVNSDLAKAIIRGGDFTDANFEGADFSGAILQRTKLHGSNLKGADIHNAEFKSPYLFQTDLKDAKNIGTIRWANNYTVGEERDGEYEKAQTVYSGLKDLYKEMSYDTISDSFQYRENMVVAENSRFPFNLLRKIYSGLPYSHGLTPLNIILVSIVVIVIFAVFYLILTLLKKIRSGIYIPANMQVSKKGRKRLISLNFNRGKIVFDCLLFSSVSLI